MSSAYRVAIENVLDPVSVNALWHDSPAAMVFNNPNWYLSVCKSYDPNRRIHHVMVWQDDELIASWPFWERRSRPQEAFARIIEPIGARVSDYTAPLVSKGKPVREIVDLMLGALRRKIGPTSILLVPKFSMPLSDDSDLSLLPSTSGLLRFQRSRPCARQIFSSTFEETELKWPKGHRRDIRRSLRRMEDQGEVSFKVYHGAEEIMKRLPVLFEMHIDEWRQKGGSSDFLQERGKDMLRMLTESLPEENINYSELLLNDKPISCQFGLIDQNWMLGFIQAMDMNYSKVAPGKLHIVHLIRWGIKQGYRGLDLMQGQEPYKKNWQNDTRTSVSYAFASKPAWPVWLWNTKYRKMKIEYCI